MAAAQGTELHGDADLNPPTSVSTDTVPEQVGSNGSTPTGIATPQPDPADKRLPSIMHNYFQSFVMLGREEGSEKLEPNLPTPPHSLLRSDEMELPSSPDLSGGSILDTLKKYLSPASSDPPSDPPSSRQTSLPVSSVSDDPVLATHFSNPCLPYTDPSTLSEAPLLDHEKLQTVISENPSKLTDNVPAAVRLKNTPPLTPRAMSNEEKKPVASAAPESETEPESSADEIAMKLDEAFPRQSSPQNGAPVGPIKGKLFVKISEARGLRPSTDPYVVCVFEWNEYISKGTRDGEEEEKKRRDQEESDAAADAAADAANAAAAEAGRPMAIPMKSRQSSYNSALDGQEPKGKAPVTDPHWDHEAVLYV
ncbi:C2 calcium/lipid-binding domain CaLB [Penicillium chermesinum]|nr:C2 calcium/lipid-binding domain CaLB [Penicillium chermesinum]